MIQDKVMGIPAAENSTKEEEFRADSNLHICIWEGMLHAKKNRLRITINDYSRLNF